MEVNFQTKTIQGFLHFYLFVDFEDPAPDVGVVLVRHVLHREHLPVFFGSGVFGPEHRVLLKRRIVLSLGSGFESRYQLVAEWTKLEFS